MPVTRVAVDSTAAVSIASAPGTSEGQVEVLVVNRGPNNVYIGDDNTVTSSTGFQLSPGDGFKRKLGRKEAIYGRCASAETANVHVFRDDVD